MDQNMNYKSFFMLQPENEKYYYPNKSFIGAQPESSVNIVKNAPALGEIVNVTLGDPFWRISLEAVISPKIDIENGYLYAVGADDTVKIVHVSIIKTATNQTDTDNNKHYDSYSISVTTSSNFSLTAKYFGMLFVNSSENLTDQQVKDIMQPVIDKDEKPTEQEKIWSLAKTQHLTNCTMVLNGDLVNGSKTTTITFTADEGFEFTTAGKIYQYNNETGFDHTDPITPTDKTKFTFTIPTVLGDATVTLSATEATEATPEKIWSLAKTQHLTNCTMVLNGDLVNGSKTTTITFTADEGFEFTTAGKIYQYDDETGADGYNPITPTDKSNFIYTIPAVFGNLTVTLTATKKTTTPTNKSVFTHMYYVTDSELSSLASERFIVHNAGSDGSVESTLFDQGTMILGLVRLPVSLPDSIIDEKQKIILGNKTSTVDSSPILSDNVTIDIGNIQVKESYNSNIDYNYTKLRLFLPFTTEIQLNPDYVVGNTIHILYNINLFSGETTVILSSSKTNEVFHTETINIGQKLPFIQLANNSNYNSMGDAVYSGIKQAYIDALSQEPIEQYNTLESGKLSSYTGYIEVQSIKLNTNATSEEQQQIKQLLSQGVYINDTTIVS